MSALTGLRSTTIRTDRVATVVLLIVSAIVVALPLVVTNAFVTRVILQVAIFAILALGLNLLFGFAGQISLGQAAFYGIGAYISALLQAKLSVAWPVAWAAAIIGTMVIAWVVSFPILRLQGHYLALGTLALGLIVQTILSQAVFLTGGSDGVVLPSFSTLGPVLTNNFPFVILGFAVLSFWLVRSVTRRSMGRALQALRDDPDGAAALGIPISRYRITVFVIAAGLAGLAGVLFAHNAQVVTPETFGVHFSIVILLMVVIGGLASNLGSIIGAVVVVVLPLVLQDLSHYQHIVYAAVVLLILLFEPGGIVGLGRRAWAAMRGAAKRGGR